MVKKQVAAAAVSKQATPVAAPVKRKHIETASAVVSKAKSASKPAGKAGAKQAAAKTVGKAPVKGSSKGKFLSKHNEEDDDDVEDDDKDVQSEDDFEFPEDSGDDDDDDAFNFDAGVEDSDEDDDEGEDIAALANDDDEDEDDEKEEEKEESESVAQESEDAEAEQGAEGSEASDDANDAEESVAEVAPHKTVEVAEQSFADFGLDGRLLKAIVKQAWTKPTLIQSCTIKEVLSGKDVLARARTGSGKTAAYSLPVLHSLLQDKVLGKLNDAAVRVLILVPSKELSKQTARSINDLIQYCSREITVVDVSSDDSGKSQKISLLEKPDIVVGTPSKVLGHLQSKALSLKASLSTLIVDEADLIFSYGYEKDMAKLLDYLPKIHQSILMSATLNAEVNNLKKLILRNPAIIQLQSDLPSTDQLAQYLIKCATNDKFLLIYSLLKLNVLQGKTLVFVNGVERCYKLKMFLEKFSIKSCVLNSELPLASRNHILSQFDEDVYDIIIASDETQLIEDESAPSKKKKGSADVEYGVTRGIDFKRVKNVVNFDFPSTPESYVHRVGRTARGHSGGLALSLVARFDMRAFIATETFLKEHECEPMKPYNFKMAAIEGLRYRADEAMRSVTGFAIKNARKKEIVKQMFASEALKKHFEDNQTDVKALRHDVLLQRGISIAPELKHIPDYLMPKGMKQVNPGAAKKQKANRKPHTNDPLKSFKFKSRQEVKRLKTTDTADDEGGDDTPAQYE